MPGVALPAQVLCFGEALVDRLGPPGGDHSGAGGPGQGAEDRLGGAPANVACALARLGTPAAFLGRLGVDAIGAAFAALFAERGVDTAGLQWDPRLPSRTVLVRRDHAGERSFGGFAGDRGEGFADQAVDARALLEAVGPLLAHARWLLVGTIPLAGAPAAAALEALVERAVAAGVAVAVDVNWRPTFWDPAADPAAAPTAAQIARIRPLLERADLVKFAAEEADALFGSAEPGAIRALLPRRPAVLISDGARPLRWCLAGESGRLAAFPVAVVDTTGAGDALMAGLLHGLCGRPGAVVAPAKDQAIGGGGAEDLVRFAAACGALVCQAAGAIDPQPALEEVEGFLSRQSPAGGAGPGARP